MIRVSIESKGDLSKDLENLYSNFPLGKISKKVQEDIKQQTVDNGWTRIAKTIKRRIVDKFIHEVYIGGKDSDITVYLDEGTKDHRVEPKDKKALHWISEGKGFFSKGHFVKGIKAFNFFKVYESTSNWITQTVNNFVKNGR